MEVFWNELFIILYNMKLIFIIIWLDVNNVNFLPTLYQNRKDRNIEDFDETSSVENHDRKERKKVK